MSISSIAFKICFCLNRINPRGQEENIVIRYGLELLMDSVLKISLIQIVGCLIGSGIDMSIILFVFCTFRLQAGGSHSSTGVGCTLSMMGICFTSLLGGKYLIIKEQWLCVIYLIVLAIVMLYAPKTININYFTKKDIIRKKSYSVVFLTILILAAGFNPKIRALIICPIIFEAVTLLPEYKTLLKKGV